MNEIRDRRISKESETRRDFLRHAAAALLVSHPLLLAAAGRRDLTVAQPSPLKTEAQYRSEAARYDAAVRDINSALAMRLASDADIPRLTTIIGRAGADLDYQESLLVILCYSDPALVQWVRQEIRDEATFLKFVDGVKRDPRVIDNIPGVASLYGRMAQRTAADSKAIIQLLIMVEKASFVFGAPGVAPSLSVMAGVVIGSTRESIAREAATFGLLGASISAGIVTLTAGIAAAGVASAPTRTGADLARTAFVAANQRFQQCVASTNLLQEPARARAILVCQAKMLAEKAPFLG